MTEKQVCRYLELVNRRLFILIHSGVEWLQEYSQELDAIDRELEEMRKLVDEEHEKKEKKTMMKVFRDYAEVNEKLLEGFTVANVVTGINADESGMMLELERQIGNATICVDVIYNPSCEDGETPFMVSEEYAKEIEV